MVITFIAVQYRKLTQTGRIPLMDGSTGTIRSPRVQEWHTGTHPRLQIRPSLPSYSLPLPRLRTDSYLGRVHVRMWIRTKCNAINIVGVLRNRPLDSDPELPNCHRPCGSIWR
jgi:hypothetical protein